MALYPNLAFRYRFSVLALHGGEGGMLGPGPGCMPVFLPQAIHAGGRLDLLAREKIREAARLLVAPVVRLL